MKCLRPQRDTSEQDESVSRVADGTLNSSPSIAVPDDRIISKEDECQAPTPAEAPSDNNHAADKALRHIETRADEVNIVSAPSHCRTCQLTALVGWMRVLPVMLRQAAEQQVTSTSRRTSIPFPAEAWTAQAPLLPLARIPLPEATARMKLQAQSNTQTQRLTAGAWPRAVQSYCLEARPHCSGRLCLRLGASPQ